jgi:hypothetical protein
MGGLFGKPKSNPPPPATPMPVSDGEQARAVGLRKVAELSKTAGDTSLTGNRLGDSSKGIARVAKLGGVSEKKA